jgi:hypothetical protein
MTTFNKIIPIIAFALTIFIATESIASDYGDRHRHSKREKKIDRANFRVRCSKVQLLDAQLDMVPPIGPATGPANFIIGGEPMLATATVELLGAPQLQPDGTANILVQIQYDFGEGDVLLAFARGVLTETERLGVFENNALISYLGGSGVYEKAYGRFDAGGFLNFADFIVEMSGKGEVCNRQRTR